MDIDQSYQPKEDKLNKISYKILQWITFLGIILMMVFFIWQKVGYHTDEILSYEFANAEYNPRVVPTQPVGRFAKFMHEEIQ